MPVQTAIARLQGQNAHLRRENALLKEERERTRSQIRQGNKLTSDIQQLLTTVNKLEGENAVMRGQMKQMVAVLIEMEAQLAEKQTHKEQIKAKMFRNEQYWANKLEEASQLWKMRAQSQQNTTLQTMRREITALKQQVTLKDCLLREKQTEIEGILLRFEKWINK